MHETADHHGWRMAMRTVASVLTLTIILAGSAAAQAPPSDTPPVAVGSDWRYEKRSAEGADLHQFWCQQPGCGPHSAVSYRIYAPHAPMTLEQYQQDQDRILRVLQERAAPGTKITLLDATGDAGGKLPS